MRTKVALGVGVLAFVLLALGLGIGLSNIAADNDSEVDQSGIIVNIPGQGRVRGGISTTSWSNKTFMQFLSIPYAEATGGTMRFKAPVSRLPWKHIHDSTKYSLDCPTMADFGPQPITSELAEDCLSLSVYTKSLNASAPVIVFVIGGAFVIGNMESFHGKYILNEDVVLVVVQYRLGPLGFLSSNTPDLPGNMAVADTIMALEWVQKYIHNFGGNKNLVTLAGESAGSWLTSVVLMSPRTRNKNLFHRVIMQSGEILSRWQQDTDPVKQTLRFCRNLKCSDCENYNKMYQCLMQSNVIELRNAVLKEKFEPKIESQLEIMPQHPMILLKNYNGSIPIMFGFQRHDGTMPLMEIYSEVKKKGTDFDKLTVREFVVEILNKVTDYSGVTKNVLLRLMFDKTPGLLESNDHQKALPAYVDIATILFMKASIINMAKRLTAKNIASRNNANIYAYSCDYVSDDPNPGFNANLPWKNTANHGDYNYYLFAPKELKTERDIMNAQQMVALWTTFVTTGIPKDREALSLLPMTGPTGPYYHVNINITQGNDLSKELTTTLDDPNNINIINADVPF